jgi:uncharacterized membrane protein YraQ (UPF0718 family)
MNIAVAALMGGLRELAEYLSAHVLTCLVPAFFIAGGITVAVSTGAVLKYFGPTAKKHLSYGVASVSGVVLAVCSCTILPLFAGIHRKGAGLGPAVTFLYSGPAINLLAIVLTARKLGWDLGAARAVGAVAFSLVIGLLMAAIYHREERQKAALAANPGNPGFDAAVYGGPGKTTPQLLAFFGVLVAILLFGTAQIPLWNKVAILIALLNSLVLVLAFWFSQDEVLAWLHETWRLVRLIFPVLLIGVFAAGIIKVLLPETWVQAAVGGNTWQANLLASVVGALMYFSTLTEVPIVKALLDLGMGKGPALALLLAGPALSLPNMIVIARVMGVQKTAVYVSLVVVMAALTGYLFGVLVG